VFWLHASSSARFEQSIRNTLEELQVPGVNEPTANIFQLFRAWLLDRKRRRPWLIVLDNADDARFLLQPPNPASTTGCSQQITDIDRLLDYLPSCEYGELLVTSRTRAAALELVEPDDILDICPMEEPHAIALLRQKLGSKIGFIQEELLRLALELDSMPLAMSQAAAYIRERAPRCSVSEYVRKLTTAHSRLSLLNRSTADRRRDRQAENCILKTWQISFEHIRQVSSSAADLLSLMSFFDRHAIPESLLHTRNLEQDATTNAYPQIDDRVSDQVSYATGTTAALFAEDLDDDLHILRSYSFVAITSDPSVFEMHRLVQFAMQDWLKAHDSFERWVSQFMTNLNEAFPEGEFENKDICQPLFPHVFAAMDTKLHTHNATLLRASILEKGAKYARVIGAYTDSQMMHEAALQSRDTVLGPEHPDTFRSMLDSGHLLRSLGQYEKAESMHQKAFDIATRVLGEDDEITFHCMHELAKDHLELGRLADAEKLQVKVLHHSKTKYGENSRNSLAATNTLASTLSRMRRDEEAADLRHRTLEIARKLYPAGHPVILAAQHNLAASYHETGRYEEARQLLEGGIPRRAELFGADHPDTLSSVYNLSRAIYELGRRQSAMDLMRDCADKSARRLGPDHPRTVGRYKTLEEWEAEDESHKPSSDGKDTTVNGGAGVN
jgi:tetratricopeptide (TPR) repeat protein